MYGYYYKEGKSWEDAKLWKATQDNPQEDINIESFLNQDNYWNIGSFKEFAKEMQLVLKADYSYPIILDKEHRLVDGAHRLVHAYLDGKTNIKGVIIKDDQWPEPDYDETKSCQNKQKPIIEVESKFKVGDWVAINPELRFASPLYIKDIDKSNYKVESLDGNSGTPTIDYLDNHFHRWSIKDAKDGDVLWHSDSASNGIFIFKEIRHDGKVLCYCDYDSEDHFCLGEHHTCCWINDKYIKPATKEQRYLLFKKMKESGYKWDIDEKELIKL